MIAAIKAEFRKLLTVRSTYVITALVAFLVIIIGFYLQGWRLAGPELLNPSALAGDITGAMNITIFGAIVAILLMTHEYRYNTIMHTLTSSRRGHVLFAKFLTVSVYALFLTVLIGVLAPVTSALGVHLHGNTLVPQTVDYSSIVWRCLFYGWGYGMAGLLLAILTRNQIGSIVALFLIPSMVEQLLGFLLLKHNAIWMPFTALTQVVNGSMAGSPISNDFSYIQAAGVFCLYLVVGWIVATVLFLRRDAN